MSAGRRLPIGTWDDPDQPQMQGMQKLTQPEEPGDYCGPIMGYTGQIPSLFFKLPVPDDHPDAGIRHVSFPPHSFTEEEDGTITVSPSILAVRPNDAPADPPPWHGYLQHGEWVVV